MSDDDDFIPEKKMHPMPKIQQRLDDMEAKWLEANTRQKASINRLMVQRSRALEILNQPHSMMCAELKRSVIEALNS